MSIPKFLDWKIKNNLLPANAVFIIELLDSKNLNLRFSLSTGVLYLISPQFMYFMASRAKISRGLKRVLKINFR